MTLEQILKLIDGQAEMWPASTDVLIFSRKIKHDLTKAWPPDPARARPNVVSIASWE